MAKDFDSEAWQASFVATGANPSLAKSLAERTLAATKPAPAIATPLTSKPVSAADINAAIQLAVEQTQSGNFSPDLFADDAESTPPAKVSQPQQSTARTRHTPLRRGRKPVPMDQKAPTAQQQDLFELSMEIERKNAAESDHDRGFIATSMIYASLPHSDPETNIFKRSNGDVKLTIMNDPDIGLPYGKVPRIITAFLCTEAKRNGLKGGRTINLGNSQAEFMAKLGMNSTGGKNGDIGRVHDQAFRLFTSTIQLIGEPGSEKHWRKVDIAPEGMLLWNPLDAEEKSKWNSRLLLGEGFFEDCIKHSVPIDMRLLRKFRSPLAIDIYIWLTYRFNSVNKITRITWPQLQWQFGSSYAQTPQGLSDFKTNFKKQLANVLAVYRDANVKAEQDVLILNPSRSHVAPAIKG